jgi:hypothetical protein
MKEIQIFRKEIQAGGNKFQIRRNEIQIKNPCFPSPKLAFSMTYADPQSILHSQCRHREDAEGRRGDLGERRTLTISWIATPLLGSR